MLTRLITAPGAAPLGSSPIQATAQASGAVQARQCALFKELSPHGVHVGVIAVCGIVEPGGPFDPDRVAGEYWRLATAPRGLADREVTYQPKDTDPFYNDPERLHARTTPPPGRG